jgi:hypothetical protein
MRPVSSSCSLSLCWKDCSDGNDLFRGLACDGEDVDRLSPKAAAALGLLELVMRDERAGVVWNDITRWQIFSLLRRTFGV